MICKKCKKYFEEKYSKWSNGDYCSRKCANSRSWTDYDKDVKRKAAIESEKCKISNEKRRKIKKIICPICKNEFVSSKKQVYCSRKCCDLDVNFLYKKKGKKGGCKKGSGRSKHGYYKNIYCGSTYELAFLIYNLDKNIPIKRCEIFFNYEYKGEIHKYFPDFEIDNIIYEIKGWKDDRHLFKIQSVIKNNRLIEVIDKSRIQFYIKYVLDTYKVKKIFELYDDYKPEKKFCKQCSNEFIVDRKSKGMFCSRVCTGKWRAKQKHIAKK